MLHLERQTLGGHSAVSRSEPGGQLVVAGESPNNEPAARNERGALPYSISLIYFVYI